VTPEVEAMNLKACQHGRFSDRCPECALKVHVDQLESIVCLLRKENAIHKERGDLLHDLVRWAYQRSSQALMMPPSKPREARAEREQAICDINKKLGGFLR
jgi:hypothetical protein